MTDTPNAPGWYEIVERLLPLTSGESRRRVWYWTGLAWSWSPDTAASMTWPRDSVHVTDCRRLLPVGDSE